MRPKSTHPPTGSARLFTDEQEAQIIEDYLTPLPDGTWQGATMIARKWETVPQSVYNILKRHGVPTRSAKEAHGNGKACKPITNLPPEGEDPPPCKCGCGKPTEWNRAKKKWRLYIPGHREHQVFRNREWLYNEYVVRNRTIAEIGADAGVYASTIGNWLRKHGIPTRNMSEARIGRSVGPKNPAWKGGVTPERQRLYKSQKWLKLIKSIYRRDNYTCQRCGTTKNYPRKFHVHHITPWAECEALRFDHDNLITLCHDCHHWVHSLENDEGWFCAVALG